MQPFPQGTAALFADCPKAFYIAETKTKLMLKKLLPVLCLAATSLHTQAQYFTLRAAGGYAFPGLQRSEGIMGPKVDPYSPEKDGLLAMSNINDSVPSFKIVNGSYGQGGNFTFAFGYMINNYIGVEMGLSYLKSAKISCDQTRELTIQTGFGNPPAYSAVGYFMNAHIETQAFGLSLMPALIVQGAKPGWKVYPYGRLGISLPVYGALKHTISIDVEDRLFSEAPALANLINQSPFFLGRKTEVELETEGTVSLGFNGALGVAYRPLPYLAITAEINGQHLVTRAKSAEITKWDTDGNSRLQDRGTYRTQFHFVDELNNESNNADYNAAYDKNKAKDDLRPTGPFSNIGFNVGVNFLLSKETIKKTEKKKE